MYFINRIQLGGMIAEKLSDLRGKELVVVCLNENSLTTGIGLATQLRGWIYPLLYRPIIIPGDSRVLGAINEDGKLCYNPSLSSFEIEELEMDYAGLIQDLSRDAFHDLNMSISSYGSLNKNGLNGRSIILCSDILKDDLAIGVVNELLKSISTNEIIGTAGNIETKVVDEVSLLSSKNVFMDVLSNMFDDDHYFEQPDAYSIEEQRQIAMNISTYWK